jgi:polyisoprenoid-binding protein YceI
MRLRLLCAVGLGMAVASVSIAGLAALSSPSDAHVGFQASGPAGLKIEGTTTELTVSEASETIAIDVPLANLSSGIALRDRHMKEKYLEVPRYPSATLLVARSALRLPQPGGSVEGDAAATLKLHGQSHAVTVHYDARGDAAGFAVRGKLRVNMNDYGITVPTYLGVTVKPDVDITASFHVAGS